MARLTRIYTRTGDKGKTGLVGGKRVSKDAPRIWACGAVDELNSAIGVARSLKPDQKTDAILADVQNNLFHLGAELATPADNRSAGMPHIEPRHIRELERLMNDFNVRLGPLREFIMPGGTPVAAQLHSCRAICRRAERSCVRLAGREAVRDRVLPYLNRLGDALFVLARWANHKAGKEETFWRK